MNVSAAAPFGAPMLGSLYSDSPSGQSTISPPSAGGVKVKNLAPVNVQAQMPLQPGIVESLWQWKNDHQFLGNLAQGVLGNIPLLGQVMVVANAYENYKHGRGMINDLANMFRPSTQDAPSAPLFPGGPLGTNAQNPLYANLYQSPILGDGANTGDSSRISALGGGPGIASSGALPAYPGLSALSGGSAPLGGFWNQRALHDAAPVYGPYAGFGHGTPSYPLAGVQIAPAGIMGA